MKVCVVGGAGYIGSHTVFELLREKAEIVVIDNLTTGDRDFVPSNATFYKADITNQKEIEKIFKKECEIKPFDVVMNFAAKLIVSESVQKPLEYYYNNVEGLRILLSVMKDYKINNIVFSSTAAVYGNPQKYICEEDDCCNPINPYGLSKLACEGLIKSVCYAYNMNYCIFRYFNVAGADKSLKIGLNKQQLTHLIPVTIEAALGLRKKVEIFGDNFETKDGTGVRDYIHVTDLAKAHVLGANYLMNNHKDLLVNLGSNNGYSVKEILSEVSKIKKVPYEIGQRKEGDPAMLIASNEKAKKILGWSPKLSLEDMIKSDMAYRKKINKK